MEDKMVELRRFTLVSEAEILAGLLKSEGVECYVRDCFINQIYSGVDFGGVKIELLEKDLQRAKEIMQAFGETGEDGDALGTADTGGACENGETGEDGGNEGNLDTVEASEPGEDGDTWKTGEDVLAAYERKKAKLSRTMTFISILIIILVAILIYLNKYFNGN